jgi:hypothetical protein
MPINRCLLIAVSILVALALPASASAATPSKVVVSFKLPAFNGKVQSSKAACTKDRKVKLYRVKAGPDKLLGTDRTDDKGKWLIPAKLKSGDYYAKAPKSGTCAAAKSGILPVA